MNIILKTSQIFLMLMVVSTFYLTKTDALSIDGSSSSYQITGEVQTPVAPTTSAPKAPAVREQTSAVPGKTALPPRKKVIPAGNAKRAVPPPVHRSAPDGRKTSEVLKAASNILLKNLPVVSTIQSTLNKVAEGSQEAVHASAPDITSQMSSLLQYLTFGAFILFAFGLGCIAVPLKR